MSINLQNWLTEPSSTPVYLIELSGANKDPIYIASQPFVSSPTASLANISFLDLLAAQVEFNATVSNSIELSDLVINDPAPADYEHRNIVVKLGDASWRYNDFAVVATGTTSHAKRLNDYSISVGFIDPLKALDVVITSGAAFSGTVLAVVTNIISQISLPAPALVGFGVEQLATTITLDASDNRNMLSSIKTVCASIGAFPRTNLLGELELVFPFGAQATTTIITLDDLTDVRELSSIEPKDIELTWTGGTVTASNNIGVLEKRSTLINNAAHAQIEANRIASSRAVLRRAWRADMSLVGALLMIGSSVQASPDLVANKDLISNQGVITRYRKLLGDKRVEVEVLQ